MSDNFKCIYKLWEMKQTKMNKFTLKTLLNITLAVLLISSCPTKSNTLKTLLKNALTPKINDREMFMKGIDYSYYYEENN